MPELRDSFRRAIGEAPRFDADVVRALVARRRRRRRVVAGTAVVAATAIVGVSIGLASRHTKDQVLIAPTGESTSTSAPPSTTAPTSTTAPIGPAGPLGYPEVETHPEAFRGDGRLVYYSGGALRIIDGDAPPRSIPIPGAPEKVRWSFDGKWIAVQTHSGPTAQNGIGDLFVVPADSTHLVRVPASANDWAWSPARDVLAVTVEGPSARNGSIDVFAAPDFGAAAASPVPAEYPTGFIGWSPQGTRLIFKTYTARPPFVDVLWSLDESQCPSVCDRSPSSVPITVPHRPQEDVGLDFAGWSGDGTRLLVWLDYAHSASVRLDGLAVESVPIDAPGADAQLPTMLAKPSWIAAVPGSAQAIVDVGGDRVWDAHRQLDACDLDRGRCTSLVVGKGPVLDPAISPDGNRLAYVTTDRVVFANPNELPPKSSIRWTRSRRLVVSGVGNEDPKVIAADGVVAPRWAADSRHLVFWRAGYLWLIDADHPDPVAIVGQLAARADNGFGFGAFEQYPYILPGDDVWDSADWQQ